MSPIFVKWICRSTTAATTLAFRYIQIVGNFPKKLEIEGKLILYIKIVKLYLIKSI